MLIAGEASGDLLAAELVKALKQSPEIRAMPFPPEFFGGGGAGMAEAGVELAVNLTQNTVIGLSDPLKKYWQFKRIFDQLFQLATGSEPDVIICAMRGQDRTTQVSRRSSFHRMNGSTSSLRLLLSDLHPAELWFLSRMPPS